MAMSTVKKNEKQRAESGTLIHSTHINRPIK
jgi:hypothetical protein